MSEVLAPDNEAAERYIQKSCIACGVVRDQPFMKAVNESILVSRTSGTYSSGSSSRRSNTYSSSSGKPNSGRYSNTSSTGNNSRTTSGKSTYKYVTNWYCSSCYEARARRRRNRIAVISSLSLVGIAVFIFLASAGSEDSGNSTATVAESAALSDTLNETPLPTPESLATNAEAAEDPNEASGAIGEGGGPPVESNIAAGETARGLPEKTITPDTSEELREAVIKSLKTGKAARWRESGSISGYVSSSLTQEYPDKVCRSFIYTIKQRGTEITSPVGLGCKFPGQDWEIQVE